MTVGLSHIRSEQLEIKFDEAFGLSLLSGTHIGGVSQRIMILRAIRTNCLESL